MLSGTRFKQVKREPGTKTRLPLEFYSSSVSSSSASSHSSSSSSSSLAGAVCAGGDPLTTFWSSSCTCLSSNVVIMFLREPKSAFFCWYTVSSASWRSLEISNVRDGTSITSSQHSSYLFFNYKVGDGGCSSRYSGCSSSR